MLVNNAAHSVNGGYAEMDAATLDAHYAVNVRAPVLLSCELARRHPHGEPGRIVCLTSGQSLGPMLGELPYATTKAALEMFVRQLAPEVMALGITVNAVNPGVTDTGWVTDAIRADVLPRMPAGPDRRERGRGAADRVAVLRRRGLGHRAGDRLRGRLRPPLGRLRGSGARTIHAAGAITSTAPPIASAATPIADSARPPTSASAAPVSPASRSLKPSSLPRSHGAAQSASVAVAATNERFQPIPRPNSATAVAGTLSTHSRLSAEHGHHQQAAGERRRAADAVDQRADHEHERVHARSRARR